MPARRRYKPPVHQRGYGIFGSLLSLGKTFGKKALSQGLKIGKQQLRKHGPSLLNKAKNQIIKQAMKKSPAAGNVLKEHVFSGNSQNRPTRRRPRTSYRALYNKVNPARSRRIRKTTKTRRR